MKAIQIILTDDEVGKLLIHLFNYQTVCEDETLDGGARWRALYAQWVIELEALGKKIAEQAAKQGA